MVYFLRLCANPTWALNLKLCDLAIAAELGAMAKAGWLNRLPQLLIAKGEPARRSTGLAIAIEEIAGLGILNHWLRGGIDRATAER